MPDNKKMPPHIKVYFKSDVEKTTLEEHAKEQGYSASSWLRILGLKQVKKDKRREKQDG